jgi:general secretion pathway protein G
MKRSGFTMIELIFVIVILGILAAVAIPRLAATRDDAKISTKTQEATQFIQELSAYYTSHGTFAKVQDMSNVKVNKTKDSEDDGMTVDMNSTTGKVYLSDGNKLSCVEFTASDVAGKPAAGSYDGNITVKNLSGASTVCKGVEKMLADKNVSSTTGITHTFGGSSVTY